MYTWLKKMADIKEEIHKRLSYPYLSRHLDTPYIDEDRLLFLLLPFQEETLKENVKHYITTAMLIQIALDTHEKVSVSDEDPPMKRQIKVLAGDYFSGLYYQILAEVKNVSMIRIFAKSIKQINEGKIAIYQHENQSTDEVMSSIKTIESGVAQGFYSYFQYSSYSSLVSEILFLKRLLQERTLFLKQKPALLFDALKSVHYPAVQDSLYHLASNELRSLLHIGDQYIQSTKQKIEKTLNSWEQWNPLLIEKVRSLLEAEPYSIKILAEEG
jgi:heptaprenyl diphosphate synthase